MPRNKIQESFGDDVGLEHYSFHTVDDYVRAIDTAKTPQDILNLLKAEINDLGFERFSYQVLEPPTGKQKKYYISTFPSEWIKRYNENRYISVDIRDHYAMRKYCPFTWNEAGPTSAFTPAQQQVILEATDFGIRAGGMVPIHGPGPIRAVLTVTSHLPTEEFERFFVTKRHVLHLIAAYTHEKLTQIGFHEVLPRNVKLSPREVETLTRVAEGATTEMIAAKLSISSETVTTYIKNISEKLGTSNRTQAVAIALQLGLIFPKARTEGQETSFICNKK